MKIYLAGPMRGIKDFNFPAFYAAASVLRAQGHDVWHAAEWENEVYGPLFAKSETGDLADIKHPHWNFRAAFAKDCEMIINWAEAVVVLDGWRGSSGARAEVAIAECIGLSVVEYGVFCL